jgi:hypothetical protein
MDQSLYLSAHQIFVSTYPAYLPVYLCLHALLTYLYICVYIPCLSTCIFVSTYPAYLPAYLCLHAPLIYLYVYLCLHTLLIYLYIYKKKMCETSRCSLEPMGVVIICSDFYVQVRNCINVG